MDFIKRAMEQNVIITDVDKINMHLEEKSQFRYNQILDKLISYHTSLTDEHLHDFYRYDLRFRRLLFKYLTVYEIMLRGKVLNSITDGFERVEKLTFGQLIDQYYTNQPDLIKVKNLRNLIFHHQMIQLEDETKVIQAIDIMLRRLNKEKFYNELERLKVDLVLIKAFSITDESIKYDFVRSD